MSSKPETMLGMELPDVDTWSDRVTVALGQNPGVFTGPGTNTYLVGTGPMRVLLDTGEGRSEYMPVLESAIERAGCRGIQEIVLTHGHRDHLGGVESVRERFGPLTVSKLPYDDFDDGHALDARPLGDGSVVETEGATLRAVHTPGHAPDHLCFLLEEERSLFSGDNVLGVGTTVIPIGTGDLSEYMASLDRLLELDPTRIYPAHGPAIDGGSAKIREYIAHRNQREEQVLAALADDRRTPMEIVRVVYAAYPEKLYPAAAQSVTQHLLKLEREQRVSRVGDDPASASWTRC